MCLLTATVYLELEVTSGIFKGLAERNLNLPKFPMLPLFVNVLNERVQEPDQVRRWPWRMCVEADFMLLFSLRLRLARGD